MKKILVSMALAVSAAIASAEYKVINLVNGTNDVQVDGAILPIGVEVCSTQSNKLVSISKLSNVDLFKKVYDISTNEHRWTETQIITNYYFQLNNKLLEIDEVSCLTNDSRNVYSFFADDEYVMVNSNCFTNRNLSAQPVVMSFSGETVDVTGIAKNGDRYVAATDSGMWYTSNPTNWTRGVMPEGFSDVGYYNCYYGRGMFVAKNNYGFVSSSDGITWESLEIGNNVSEGIYANGKYLYKGYTGGLYAGNHPTNMTQVVSASTNVISMCYGNGLYVFSDYNGRVWHSVDSVSWVLSDFSFSPYKVNSIFFDALRQCFYLKLYINDGRGELRDYSYASSDFVTFNTIANSFEADAMVSTESGEVYALVFIRNSINVIPVKLKQIGLQIYEHASGSYGASEQWSAGPGFMLDYNPASFGSGMYWKQTTGSNITYSNERKQRPSYLQFPFPSYGSQSQANLNHSVVTNYIEHYYDYITNRVYNIIATNVTTTTKIVDAQCVDGAVSSQITNKVYVVGGDRIVVDGVIQDETESTKATLIVQ